jgi:trans-2,3-dihydro-3-hydroxyanthranilate isomerase
VAAPDLLAPDLPLQAVSCGVPFLYVPLRTRAAVDAVEIDRAAVRGLFAAAGMQELPIFAFSPEPAGDGATAYSRMFAPGLGVPEDPATGAASGPLGAYLVHHGVVAADAAHRIVSLQGVRMGRPGRIHIAITLQHDGIAEVRVGGGAVLVGDGALRIDGTEAR